MGDLTQSFGHLRFALGLKTLRHLAYSYSGFRVEIAPGCVFMSETMSIVTKTGDLGQTSLMYNRRVSKCDPRVEAYGTVDELNSAIGLARAWAKAAFVQESLLGIQADLIVVMGELATDAEDLPRYKASGRGVTTPDMTSKLDELAKRIESQNVSFKGWATPGQDPCSAGLDFARTVCRRVERQVCALSESGQFLNPEAIVYLNRLSDCLWLLARWVETQSQPERPAAE